jgi:hypothetical protein
MSDATKGAGDDGQPRFRRSWFEHAGEVTKKKKVTDETNTPQTEEPPQPTGPKIGGARDFRRTRLSLDVADNDTGAADSDLLTTGGVQAYVQKVGAGPDTTHSRSLAAQPGWRLLGSCDWPAIARLAWTTRSQGQQFLLRMPQTSRDVRWATHWDL